MWEQEKEHVQKFEELLPKYRVRPTALLPFWNVAGYALGNIPNSCVITVINTQCMVLLQLLLR